eukprot:CAMPEP_0204052404 /NCGR_PEP_ID=MMETSP0360-20130528/124439_1 /ASSEMBLY_ACC=CAM_ASM_000342 /TAXON_ID=268821 /ORGANISM="Scrippsiella Hangoei, Strain SHTV-5" /LENGTH=50 /DNA_ID=CAMNT_0050999501 /DNA_START=337 /DNA_END=489 /DNA_ORIENTATION=+
MNAQGLHASHLCSTEPRVGISGDPSSGLSAFPSWRLPNSQEPGTEAPALL